LLIWLGAAVAGWAVVIGLFLYVPQALVCFAVAGIVLWRKGQRTVYLAVPATEQVATTTGPAAGTPDTAPLVRVPDDVRELMAHPV
jgi:hypothetical protein